MMNGCFFLLTVYLVSGALSDIGGRIIGGFPKTIDQYPYQISLQRGGKHICGGSIVSPVWVITAAHCIEKKNIPHYSVRSGSSYSDDGGVITPVKDITVHENFDATYVDYDIAVVELQTPLTFNMFTKSILLPSSTEYLRVDGLSTVTGWGTLMPNGNRAEQLQAVMVPLVSRADCVKAYNGQPISERMICAGYINKGGKDACQGDSGGPLMYNRKLIGIVSWGFGCGNPNFPGVYSRVTIFRSWIEEKTGL